MERFNYKRIKDVLKEDGAILQLLELESYGYKKDQQEEIEAMKHNTASGGGERWQGQVM